MLTKAPSSVSSALRQLILARFSPHPHIYRHQGLHYPSNRDHVLLRRALRSRTLSSASSSTPAPGSPRPPSPSLVVLGIETSCDDTGAAVVSGSGRVLGEAIAHQYDVHRDYGGVVPMLAQQAHADAIDRVIDEALRAAEIHPRDLSAVAVTIGPGLSLCLRVGVEAAERLAKKYQLPFIPVHHMEAHALVARLPIPEADPNQEDLEERRPPAATVHVTPESTTTTTTTTTSTSNRIGTHSDISTSTTTTNNNNNNNNKAENTRHARTLTRPTATVGRTSRPRGTAAFPFLCLLVSGGHNLILLARDIGDYEILGTTLDDALGEAYDKVAKMLHMDLEPSGGVVVEAAAARGDPHRYKFTLPLRDKPGSDFSFSGLKTAVRLAMEASTLPQDDDQEGWDRLTPEQEQTRCDIAASFQEIAIQHVLVRLRRAVQFVASSSSSEETTSSSSSSAPCSALVVAGGVAANQRLRAALESLCAEEGLPLICPPPRYCTDNGVMVAWAGVERARAGLFRPEPRATRSSDKEEEAEEERMSSRDQSEESSRTTSATSSSLTNTTTTTTTTTAGEAPWVDVRARWPIGPSSYVPARNPKARWADQPRSRRSLKKRGLHPDLGMSTHEQILALAEELRAAGVVDAMLTRQARAETREKGEEGGVTLLSSSLGAEEREKGVATEGADETTRVTGVAAWEEVRGWAEGRRGRNPEGKGRDEELEGEEGKKEAAARERARVREVWQQIMTEVRRDPEGWRNGGEGSSSSSPSWLSVAVAMAVAARRGG